MACLEAKYSNDSIFNNMEDGAIITKIALRFQKIGPVLRHLFHPDDEYEDFFNEIKI
jgi:hypothetical protein